MLSQIKNYSPRELKEFIRQKKFQNNNMVSYEDLLVAEYLEQFQNKQMRKKPRRPSREWVIENSPYSQCLATSRYIKPYADNESTKGQANENFSDAYSVNQKRMRRPASAPAMRSMSVLSAYSNNEMIGRRNQRHSYETRPSLPYTIKNPPHTIVASVYKNGYCDISARVAAPDLRLLLEQCTEKLQLPFAARCVYLEGGTKVNSPEDIPYGASIYVSMGEPYKDPFSSTKKTLEEQKNLTWTLSGITLPPRDEKKRKSFLSKRMKALTTKKNARVIVYRNGLSMEPVEIVADLSKMDEFLAACTTKLNLGSFARILYDWEGQQITNLSEIPLLHDYFQQPGNVVLGPVWVSTGEVFRPSGTVHYITGLKKLIIKKLKETQLYHNELVAAKMGDKLNVSRTDVLSLKGGELNQFITKANNEILALKETLETLTSQLHNLADQTNEELSQGSEYVMQHIQKLKENHRLIGTKGLRLKVYENGMTDCGKIFYFNLREALKGTEGDYIKLKQKLLDDLSKCQRLTHTQKPKLVPVVQKLFRRTGEEVKNILSLQNDDEIWMSNGEAFIDPYTYCMQVIFDGVGLQHFEEHSAVIRKETNYKYNNEEINQWNIIKGFPRSLYNSHETAFSLEDLKKSEIEESWHLMQHKEKPVKILYPELVINQKLPKGSNHSGIIESQIWIINKNGVIYSKTMPQLCLTLCMDMSVTTQLKSNPASTITGYIVALQQKQVSNQAQMWTFYPDGTLSTLVQPEFFLTWLGNKLCLKNEEEENLSVSGIKDGHNIFLVASERLPKKEAGLQRWALKQERFDNLGQWKFTQVPNTDWNKLAYSWPVCYNTGQLNNKYDWPMEGYFIPNAPPLSKSGTKNILAGMTPLRLLVLRNGERDASKAIPVVGPNVTNMMKAMKERKTKEKPNKHNKNENQAAGDCSQPKNNVHCSNITVRQLEFSLFLDSCTNALKLPSAGRRLFDSNGTEHHSLQDFNRDQIVYVSCHESWIDPKITKTEQQRRILLAQLSSDMTKIYQYCSLRNLENYILKVDGSLCAKSKIVIRQLNEEKNEEGSLPESDQVLGSVEKEAENQKESQEMTQLNNDNQIKETMSHHDISHARAEERFNQLKWPWEKLYNVDGCLEDPHEDDDDEDDDDDHDAVNNNNGGGDASELDNKGGKYGGKLFYEQFKRRPVPLKSSECLSRFTYEDNYLACVYNKNLVLGTEPTDSRVVEVVLMKRSPDNIHQQWIVKTNGEIQSMHNYNSLLSVSFQVTEKKNPGFDGQFSCEGCPVVLMQAKSNDYGNAHQKWYYDAETGYIHAFHTEVLNKEITAANQTNVCTFAITSEKKINQPGYTMIMQEKSEGKDESQKVTTLMLCESCAHTMRGKYPMQKLEEGTQFSCATGQSGQFDFPKLQGSFQILNSKVDLSTHEALLTLKHWEERVQRLREITSVHTIATEIAATQNVRTVKLLAYKNGDGRLRNGQLIKGSSIEGLLQQCTQRLGLVNAARRMYTEDGKLILKMDDLVNQAVENCKSEFEHQIDKYIKDKQNEENKVNDSKENGVEVQEKEISTEGDQKENEKVSKEKEILLSKISLPSLNVILNFPIEVWVSSGRNFVSPEVVESKEENRKKKRALCADIALELDLQKHILRKEKGRRLDELHPGDYKSTQSSKQPVVITGHWAKPSNEECERQNKVHKLQNHLNEVKANQKESVEHKQFNPKMTKRLYKQPDTKRIKVYPNGENREDRSVYIFGSSLQEILDQAKEKLRLWKKAKMLFTTEGKLIESFKDINRDDILCVSTGQPFLSPLTSQQDIQLKAQWARARKIHGPQIADITVISEQNPVVNVDPFAAPTRKRPPLIKIEEKK